MVAIGEVIQSRYQGVPLKSSADTWLEVLLERDAKAGCLILPALTSILCIDGAVQFFRCSASELSSSCPISGVRDSIVATLQETGAGSFAFCEHAPWSEVVSACTGNVLSAVGGAGTSSGEDGTSVGSAAECAVMLTSIVLTIVELEAVWIQRQLCSRVDAPKQLQLQSHLDHASAGLAAICSLGLSLPGGCGASTVPCITALAYGSSRALDAVDVIMNSVPWMRRFNLQYSSVNWFTCCGFLVGPVLDLLFRTKAVDVIASTACQDDLTDATLVLCGRREVPASVADNLGQGSSDVPHWGCDGLWGDVNMALVDQVWKERGVVNGVCLDGRSCGIGAVIDVCLYQFPLVTHRLLLLLSLSWNSPFMVSLGGKSFIAGYRSLMLRVPRTWLSPVDESSPVETGLAVRAISDARIIFCPEGCVNENQVNVTPQSAAGCTAVEVCASGRSGPSMAGLPRMPGGLNGFSYRDIMRAGSQMVVVESHGQLVDVVTVHGTLDDGLSVSGWLVELIQSVPDIVSSRIAHCVSAARAMHSGADSADNPMTPHAEGITSGNLFSQSFLRDTVGSPHAVGQGLRRSDLRSAGDHPRTDRDAGSVVGSQSGTSMELVSEFPVLLNDMVRALHAFRPFCTGDVGVITSVLGSVSSALSQIWHAVRSGIPVGGPVYGDHDERRDCFRFVPTDSESVASVASALSVLHVLIPGTALVVELLEMLSVACQVDPTSALLEVIPPPTATTSSVFRTSETSMLRSMAPVLYKTCMLVRAMDGVAMAGSVTTALVRLLQCLVGCDLGCVSVVAPFLAEHARGTVRGAVWWAVQHLCQSTELAMGRRDGTVSSLSAEEEERVAFANGVAAAVHRSRCCSGHGCDDLGAALDADWPGRRSEMRPTQQSRSTAVAFLLGGRQGISGWTCSSCVGSFRDQWNSLVLPIVCDVIQALAHKRDILDSWLLPMTELISNHAVLVCTLEEPLRYGAACQDVHEMLFQCVSSVGSACIASAISSTIPVWMCHVPALLGGLNLWQKALLSVFESCVTGSHHSGEAMGPLLSRVSLVIDSATFAPGMLWANPCGLASRVVGGGNVMKVSTGFAERCRAVVAHWRLLAGGFGSTVDDMVRAVVCEDDVFGGFLYMMDGLERTASVTELCLYDVAATLAWYDATPVVDVLTRTMTSSSLLLALCPREGDVVSVTSALMEVQSLLSSVARLFHGDAPSMEYSSSVLRALLSREQLDYGPGLPGNGAVLGGGGSGTRHRSVVARAVAVSDLISDSLTDRCIPLRLCISVCYRVDDPTLLAALDKFVLSCITPYSLQGPEGSLLWAAIADGGCCVVWAWNILCHFVAGRGTSPRNAPTVSGLLRVDVALKHLCTFALLGEGCEKPRNVFSDVLSVSPFQLWSCLGRLWNAVLGAEGVPPCIITKIASSIMLIRCLSVVTSAVLLPGGGGPELCMLDPAVSLLTSGNAFDWFAAALRSIPERGAAVRECGAAHSSLVRCWGYFSVAAADRVVEVGRVFVRCLSTVLCSALTCSDAGETDAQLTAGPYLTALRKSYEQAVSPRSANVSSFDVSLTQVVFRALELGMMCGVELSVLDILARLVRRGLLLSWVDGTPKCCSAALHVASLRRVFLFLAGGSVCSGGFSTGGTYAVGGSATGTASVHWSGDKSTGDSFFTTLAGFFKIMQPVLQLCVVRLLTCNVPEVCGSCELTDGDYSVFYALLSCNLSRVEHGMFLRPVSTGVHPLICVIDAVFLNYRERFLSPEVLAHLCGQPELVRVGVLPRPARSAPGQSSFVLCTVATWALLVHAIGTVYCVSGTDDGRVAGMGCLLGRIAGGMSALLEAAVRMARDVVCVPESATSLGGYAPGTQMGALLGTYCVPGSSPVGLLALCKLGVDAPVSDVLVHAAEITWWSLAVSARSGVLLPLVISASFVREICPVVTACAALSAPSDPREDSETGWVGATHGAALSARQVIADLVVVTVESVLDGCSVAVSGPPAPGDDMWFGPLWTAVMGEMMSEVVNVADYIASLLDEWTQGGIVGCDAQGLNEVLEGVGRLRGPGAVSAVREGIARARQQLRITGISSRIAAALVRLLGSILVSKRSRCVIHLTSSVHLLGGAIGTTSPVDDSNTRVDPVELTVTESMGRVIDMLGSTLLSYSSLYHCISKIQDTCSQLESDGSDSLSALVAADSMHLSLDVERANVRAAHALVVCWDTAVGLSMGPRACALSGVTIGDGCHSPNGDNTTPDLFRFMFGNSSGRVRDVSRNSPCAPGMQVDCEELVQSLIARLVATLPGCALPSLFEAKVASLQWGLESLRGTRGGDVVQQLHEHISLVTRTLDTVIMLASQLLAGRFGTSALLAVVPKWERQLQDMADAWGQDRRDPGGARSVRSQLQTVAQHAMFVRQVRDALATDTVGRRPPGGE